MATDSSPLPKPYLTSVPTADGFFGTFGGSFIPPVLAEELDKIYKQYLAIKDTDKFKTELAAIRKDFQGRPTPLFYAGRLSQALGGGKDKGIELWLKREDLNHTGAHKLNHCISEVLLAKLLGKTKVIAETGAGQHGVALATAASYYGLACDIYMGAVDIAKESPNVTRMKILGARVIPATHGLQTLKEAVDAAFEAYIEEKDTAMYCIGSVVGPHPFPYMVREFQTVVGEEAKEQWGAQVGGKPDKIVACCGGGSNALGIFSVFIDDEEVELFPVEPLGRGGDVLGDHAASLKYGTEGVMHGFNSIMLKTGSQTEHGPEPAPVYSLASGLDYPSVGPEHAYLFSKGRTQLAGASDDESLKAFFALSKLEGIIPALESCHAVAYAMRLARQAVKDGKVCRILINLSGRGDKDIDFVWEKYGQTYGQMPVEELLKEE